MQTPYIYSVSRVNALSEFLLNRTDIERLLVAEPGTDLQSALKETYLASYVAHAPEENVSLAIEQTLIDAKRLVHRLAPKGDMFRILWVHYDIHNMRVFAKAEANGLSFDDCAQFVSERGIYDPEYLYGHASERTLDRLQVGWGDVYAKAVQLASNNGLIEMEHLFDELYFDTAKRILDTAPDAFMRRYFQRLIDLHNVKSRLRALKYPELQTVFVEGGSYPKERYETRETVLTILSDLGGSEVWTDAVEYLDQTGNTTRLDARVDDHLVTFAREAGVDMFSSASLVLYYLKCRQAAANIRTIVVGKNSGMSEADIRANLRMAYVNE